MKKIPVNIAKFNGETGASNNGQRSQRITIEGLRAASETLWDMVKKNDYLVNETIAYNAAGCQILDRFEAAFTDIPYDEWMDLAHRNTGGGATAAGNLRHYVQTYGQLEDNINAAATHILKNIPEILLQTAKNGQYIKSGFLIRPQEYAELVDSIKESVLAAARHQRPMKVIEVEGVVKSGIIEGSKFVKDGF